MPYPPRTTDESASSKTFLIAFVMAGLAGHVNSVMLIAFGLPVSQMTGTASHLSEGMALASPMVVITAVIILAGFIGGATLSGLLIGRRPFPQSTRYAWALGLESLLLGIAVLGVILGSAIAALAAAAIACGLQNALVASYRGLLIRTTHVTGIATDLGLYLARLIRRRAWAWQGWLLITLLGGYVAGGAMAVFAQGPLGTVNNLLVPTVATGLIAVTDALYQRRRRALNR
ncbi:YoaK family protein [Guyparkeria halophila]|uniref:YoaK family protein n=1 Tax=Guyparkeria halophila TaxID=47960 RepID=A0ABZ0YTN6_9GAMM|nr:YoaK family protein [Guyparkeria halophila]WQH15353.1 YoaK family protein [Guyparkeria halophila]